MEKEMRTCWVCYNSDVDEPDLSWISPCKCRGNMKWVHQHCLQRWIDEKQRGVSSASVNCRVCNTLYSIKYPTSGIFMNFLETMDNYIYKICPFFAGGLVITSLYWSGVTYGAVTVMQVMGHAEAVQVMEQMDPLLLLIGLPTVPIILVLFKLIKWDEFLLSLWQKYSFKLRILNKIFGSEVLDIPEWRHQYNTQFPYSTPSNIPRLLVDALITPSLSTIIGKMFFSHMQSKWQRSVLGCFVFVLGKGILNMYYQQKKYLRNCRRTIIDYDENTRTATVVPEPENPINIE